MQMNGTLVLWIAVALVAFWGVGVYNRLMRLRARGFDALGSLEKHMKQYGTLVEMHITASGLVLSAGPDVKNSSHLPEIWVTLLSSLDELELAFKTVRANPLSSQSMERLRLACEAVQQTWIHACNLPSDLAGPAVPGPLCAQWDSITTKVENARSGLNQILTKYNEAIHQFPARVAARLMRFEPAGLL
jgi:LemA protein